MSGHFGGHIGFGSGWRCEIRNQDTRFTIYDQFQGSRTLGTWISVYGAQKRVKQLLRSSWGFCAVGQALYVVSLLRSFCGRIEQRSCFLTPAKFLMYYFIVGGGGPYDIIKSKVHQIGARFKIRTTIFNKKTQYNVNYLEMSFFRHVH